jgi:anti-sigma regulatory factor (Ser/Thr protein kinase)
LASQAGFNETEAGSLAIAVTEAAANVLHHGLGGEILLRPLGTGIELLAIDNGPGMVDLQGSLQDGKSSMGTAGIGLGAISRLASTFEVYTGSGLGTVVAAVFYPAERRGEPERVPQCALEVGAAQSTYPGETACGDAWAAGRDRILVADGLGHGLLAAEAAMAAVEACEANWLRSPREAMEAIHMALRPTRGAAVAFAEADINAQTVRFCGVGNISASVVGNGSSRGLASQNGIVGHDVPRFSQYEYPWQEGSLLVMHSDGISAKWDLAAYPGLALRPVSLIAAVLYRDFRRQKDDATIVVARARRKPEAKEAA